MLNRALFTGRLTKDVELKYTQSGKAVGSFNLAVDRRFKNQNGEREADFINCVIWGKGAETLANFAHKGNLVGLEGRVQTRNYDDKDGKKVYVTELVVENFSLLEPKKDGGQNQQKPQGQFNNNPQQPPQGQQPPFNQQPPQGNPQTPGGYNNGYNGGNYPQNPPYNGRGY